MNKLILSCIGVMACMVSSSYASDISTADIAYMNELAIEASRPAVTDQRWSQSQPEVIIEQAPAYAPPYIQLYERW